jgi:hypothetical protein
MLRPPADHQTDEADLMPYDTFFGEVVDPLVAAGSVVYSTPDAITGAYLDAEAGGCK